MNLNIDNFGGKSVVPVFCGNYVSGTAFFVSPTKLLTAGHVLAEYILDNEATVAIIVEGEYKICKVIVNYDSPDVAVLECANYQSPKEHVLKLLNCKFKKGVEALIVGYPIELGNAEDYFGVSVKNCRQKENLKGGFDSIVVRTDSFGFNSYEGFSGAPIINTFGMVMGIETDQLYNTLGYVSVKAIKPFVEQYIDAKIEDNEDLYDNTSYGLWTSRNHILSHTCNMLKTRYNSRVHVGDEQAEKTIQSFCGYGIESENVDIHVMFKTWYAKLAGIRKQHIDSIHYIVQYLQNGLITEESTTEIENLLYENDIEKKLPSDYYKELREIYNKMIMWLHNRKLYENEQFLYLKGAAGCGKSHLLYYLSEKMTKNLHMYMFLGSEFSPLEDPVRTIARIMGWKEKDPLEALNNTLLQNKKKATIIIDALNEGAGTHFWTEQLQILKEKIQHHPQLKLIVSLRETSKEDRLNDILRDKWILLELNGFANREKAIEKYFNAYAIDADKAPYIKIEEFSNPLFLKIFCETYYYLSQEERDKALRLPIYKRYLRKRNDEVSHGVDEDPKRDITSKYILWVALRSMEEYKCGDIPRQLAYHRSQKMCPFRTWRNSLLKNCLDTNLLREYSTEEGDFVDFEFDSMGDYLKVDCLLNRKCDDNDRLHTLQRVFEVMERNSHDDSSGNWQKQYNFIRAFLSVWNPPAVIWQKPIFAKGKLTRFLLSCLLYRNMRDDENTLTPDIIGTILQQNPDFIEPQLMLQNLALYSQGMINHIHIRLLSLSMAERDLFWTTKVNELFDGAVYKKVIEPLEPTLPHEIETLLIMETWMLSCSYPYLRAYIIRSIKKNLIKYPNKAEYLIEKFHSVDDPYILEGLYAAIYGVIVNEEKADFSKAVAEKLYGYHYGDKAPQDLMVRFWTLKIFELAAHHDSTIDVWQKAQPPYALTEDIFAIMPAEDYETDDYFGETYGGKQITRSLFHWDFSRYVIGTNGDNVSRVFFQNGSAVMLKKIEFAIAFLIKHRLGWNDELGKYDSGVPYQTRHENSVERIGKKYQWIGMYRVYAYLCDTCQMRINIWSANEQFADYNYPWYAPEFNYFDPTLTDVNVALQKSHELFDVIIPQPTIQIPAKEWLKDNTKMPPLYFVINDREGDEWMPLQAYSTIIESDEKNTREQFVYYNGFFVAKENYTKLREWAAETNFYGRWMPEHSGSIAYKWNEFPWSDSYRLIASDDNTVFMENGIEMRLAYSAQLQEDFKGMPEECHFLPTAYMPCQDMMKAMFWHTAERGIIRDSQGTIVAINREMPGEPLHALLIKRKLLDDYLKQKGYVLFWSLVGEKQYGIHAPNVLIQRLSGASAYLPGQDVDIMQPLRNEHISQ